MANRRLFMRKIRETLRLHFEVGLSRRAVGRCLHIATATVSGYLERLQQAGCEWVYMDRASGAKAERPGLAEALDYVREGDTLVVWRLDRFGRSLKDLVERVGELEERGVGFRSLQEAIDTTSGGEAGLPRVRGAGGVRAGPDKGADDGGSCSPRAPEGGTGAVRGRWTRGRCGWPRG